MISAVLMPFQSAFNMEKDKCLRCGWAWYRRSPDEPRVCPKCHSPYWNKERVRGTEKKK